MSSKAVPLAVSDAAALGFTRREGIAASGSAGEVCSVPTTKLSTDASKLSFPLQIVVLIVSIAGTIWASQYGLRSDVRDILTRMEAQGKLQDERMQTMRETILDLRRRVEMQEFAVRAVQETVNKIQVQQQAEGTRR